MLGEVVEPHFVHGLLARFLLSLAGRQIKANAVYRGLLGGHFDIGNADVGGTQKFTDGLALRLQLQHLQRKLRRQRCMFVQDHQPVGEPVVHGAQCLAVELHRHGQKQGIGPGGPFPQGLGTLQAGTKLIHVLAAFGIEVALEPALGLECLVDQELLADDALRIHGKTILIAHAIKNEGDLECRGLTCRHGIQPERLEPGKGLSGLERGRHQHHVTHVLKGFDEVGLATGVGTVHHRTFEYMRSRLQPGIQRMRVQQ